ncbi:MAG: hypothetical protein PHE78_07270 [Candidatus Gastranaerophilales bacterium]|nr:hypothetical protein [Candidatus Gastranaerophilales bacterium]
MIQSVYQVGFSTQAQNNIQAQTPKINFGQKQDEFVSSAPKEKNFAEKYWKQLLAGAAIGIGLVLLKGKIFPKNKKIKPESTPSTKDITPKNEPAPKSYKMEINSSDLLKELDAKITQEPKNAELYVQRALEHKNLDNPINALDDISEAIKLEPKKIDYYQERIKLYIDDYDYPKAADDYTAIINIEPENPSHYKERGLFFKQIKRNNDALNDYNKAIELNPDDSIAYFNRSRLHETMNAPLKSLEDAKEAAVRNPADPEIKAHLNHITSLNALFHSGLAIKCAKAQDFEAAIFNSTRAIELRPNVAEYYDQRGIYHEILGNTQEAVDDYDKAIHLLEKAPGKKMDKLSEIYTKRGFSLNELDKADLAKESFKKAIKATPKDEIPYLNLVKVLRDEKNYDEAIEYITQIINKKPKDKMLYFERGSIYKEAGKIEEAKADREMFDKLSE